MNGDVEVFAPKRRGLLEEDHSEIAIVPDGVRRVWDPDKPRLCRCGHGLNKHYPKTGSGYLVPCWQLMAVGGTGVDWKRCYCRNWHPRWES